MSVYQLRALELHNPKDVRAEIASIGADSSWLDEQNDWQSLRAVRLGNISPKLARFLYQEMTLENGTVILPPRMNDRSLEPVNVIIFGTRTQFEHLIVRVRTQSVEELDLLADELARELE